MISNTPPPTLLCRYIQLSERTSDSDRLRRNEHVLMNELALATRRVFGHGKSGQFRDWGLRCRIGT